jgi:cobalt/nickel transport system permease protein
MHIEPGLLAHTTVVSADAAALALLAAHAPALLKRPALWLRTVLAAGFFSVFMELYHLPVGPSELHFVGAMPIYLLLGYLPTLFGFAAGLLLQAAWFEPQDWLHLGVNSLSLMVPLVVLHHTLGSRIKTLSVAKVIQLDAVYYTGVTLMVGYWLLQANIETPVADWLRFAASYIVLVAIEPVVTLTLVGVLAPRGRLAWARWCLDESVMARFAKA